MVARFDYHQAFCRNLGWLSEWEQARLRTARIAIAGLGGVGGYHLLALTRLGIGKFHIADPDSFELANFNRQAGARLETLGQPKAAVMAEAAGAINPELDITTFPDGVTAENLDAFLDGVDIFVDGLDFFVLDIRRKLFARCRERGIPAVTAAPLGMGAAYLVFMPSGMAFEDYFRLEGLRQDKQFVNFALGLAPKGFHRAYLDPSYVDFAGRRGPSTVMACEICAGVAATEALKILLERGRVRAAPWYHHFDAYRGHWKRGYLWRGNANPIQSLKLKAAYKLSKRMSRGARPAEAEVPPADDIEAILDEARWAPSGDNTQPWRFERTGPDSVAVHVKPSGDIYDFNASQPTLLSAGFLLETMAIVASRYGCHCEWAYTRGGDGGHHIDVDLSPGADVRPDPLHPFIRARSVERGAMRLTPLTKGEKAMLADALPEGVGIRWFEDAGARWCMAGINGRAGDIRLRLEAAFKVHQEIIDWEHRFSPHGVPAATLGLDPLARRITRFLMRDWGRMDRMNRFFGGTLLARLEMDWIPGFFCGAHFLVGLERGRARDLEAGELLRLGAGLQRFWLTATALGLAVQPSLAPLCFAHYGRDGTAFTEDTRLRKKAARLAEAVDNVAGAEDTTLFLGRIGRPRTTVLHARSLRRSLSELMIEEGQQ